MSLAFDGFGNLRNPRNLARRLCLWHFMGSEISGIGRILRAGYISGIWCVWKSEEIEILRAGNVYSI